MPKVDPKKTKFVLWIEYIIINNIYENEQTKVSEAARHVSKDMTFAIFSNFWIVVTPNFYENHSITFQAAAVHQRGFFRKSLDNF